ncbi:MAG TPA: prenyltransferase [Mycobacteriales bacterium]|nr:prenyltransferase [Mycobacteriales bacterium]
MTDAPAGFVGGKPDRAAGESLVAHVPPDPTLRQRSRGWLYAAVTSNPPTGHVDGFTTWIVLTRAAVLPMSIIAALLAGLLAVHHPGFSAVDFALAAVGVIAAHVANNVMNDLFDTDVGQDTPDYPRAQYAPHPILSGLTTRSRLATVAVGVNLLDLAIMIALTVARGPLVLAFGIGGFLLSAAYTAPPLRLKKRGLGELDVLITWGPLMVGGTYFAATGHLPWQIWVASVPYALLCTAVLMGKHTDKIAYDAPLGIRTVPVLLGRERALVLTRALIGGFYLTLLLAVGLEALPWPALTALAALPYAAKVWRPLSAPPPAAKPAGFPVWPLWYAAWTFVHTRNAGATLIVGVALAAIFDVVAF